MKQNIKMILTLVIIASISGAVLAVVFDITKPKIEEQKAQAQKEAIFEVVPDIDSYEIKNYGKTEVYKCFNSNNKLAGYAFTAEGPGYQGMIKLMIGVDSSLSSITGIKVLEDDETPGLGAKISTSWFQEQFDSKSIKENLKVIKEEPKEAYQIQAITGATVSSEAVAYIVNKKAKEIKKILEQ